MTKDTLPSPVTLSTPERLRDALERYGQHEEGCNYFADPERVTLCDCGYEAALIDAIPSPVSVPEGDAREIARRLVAEAHYGVMTNEQLEDNITAALLSAESRARPQWQPVRGWEGHYEVSTAGVIRKLTGEIIGQWLNSAGYLLARLSQPREVVFVHRVVAEAFIPNPEMKLSVNHIDNDRAQNALSNLEWCTQRENIGHAASQKRMYSHAAHMRGEASPNAKLTAADVREIRRLREGHALSFQDLAERFSVSKRTVQRICSGERWAHV